MTMYMYMNMCIIMSMNIYITPDNEQRIRQHGGSMSGLVNQLLAEYFSRSHTSNATGNTTVSELLGGEGPVGGRRIIMPREEPEPEEDEEEDTLPQSWFYSPQYGKVYDSEMEEEVGFPNKKAFDEAVKELKRRGRVR